MLQKFLYIKRLSLRNLVCKNGRRIDMKKNKFIVCSFSAKKKGKEKKKIYRVLVFRKEKRKKKKKEKRKKERREKSKK